MGDFSTIHWLIILAVLFGLLGLPIVRILRRTGHSGWWVIALLIPIVNWIGLWVFAYSKWPKVDGDGQGGELPPHP